MMKSFFLATGIAVCMVACNSSNTESATSVETDTTTNAAKTVYTPSNGDVRYSNGTVYVWRDNNWQTTHEDVMLDNGAVVHSNGHIDKGDNTVVLEDGEVVNKSGDFFDDAGHAISKGWDKTKDAAEKAGKEVKKGAKKVGEEVKDVFDGKDKKDKD